jgi:hypothetical protein
MEDGRDADQLLVHDNLETSSADSKSKVLGTVVLEWYISGLSYMEFWSMKASRQTMAHTSVRFQLARHRIGYPREGLLCVL